VFVVAKDDFGWWRHDQLSPAPGRITSFSYFSLWGQIQKGLIVIVIYNY